MASAAPDQSAQRVASMSSTDVPWPGSSGSSVANPAAANACASPRIDCGQPVKPCTTNAPCGPPGAENGSAPGSTTGRLLSPERALSVVPREKVEEGEEGSVIRVLGPEGVLPPVVGRGAPVGVRDDAVDGTDGRQAL